MADGILQDRQTDGTVSAGHWIPCERDCGRCGLRREASLLGGNYFWRDSVC